MITSHDLEGDLNALSDYFRRTPINTPDARKIRDDFIKWRDNLSLWDRKFNTSDLWDTARNYRLRFNKANAVSEADKIAAEWQATRGLSTEEVSGKSDRRLSSGAYNEEEEPFVPMRVKIVGGVLALLAGLFYVNKKITFTFK